MTPEAAATTCPQCGWIGPPVALSCGSCSALIHSESLKQLAASAQSAEQVGNASAALGHWRATLELLPAGTQQHAVIMRKIHTLSEAVDQGAAGKKERPAWIKALGPFAVVGALAWKFKVIILLALSKGKLLLFGLSKASTFLSMLLSFGAYWAVYGWRFGAGIILSIYVHEMGHVWMLRKFGIPASAPAFIPFFGAVVRLKQHPATAREDARVGLAGPIWGTAAAIGSIALQAATGEPIFGVIGYWAAWINLFNLVPVWQLDGSRAFAALTKMQRICAALALLAGWAISRDGLLIIIAVVALVRAFGRNAPEEGDGRALLDYVGLVLVLSTLLLFKVALPRGA